MIILSAKVYPKPHAMYLLRHEERYSQLTGLLASKII
jgi:hypothetical protein